jgi:serine/threonine-protein kinase
LRANIAHAHGDTASMLRDDEQAWKILHDTLGATHPQTARYGLVWARDLRGAGQAGAADALEKELRPTFESVFPADSAWRAELAKR